MEDLHAKLKETDRVYYPHGQLAGRRVSGQDIRVYMPNGREIDPRFADHVWPVTVEEVAIKQGKAVTYINRYDNEIATGEVNEQQRPDGPWYFKGENESKSHAWFVDGDPVAYGTRYEDISAHPDVLRENMARTGIKPLPKIHSLAEAEREIAAAFAAEYAEAEKEIVSGFIAEGRMGIPSADVQIGLQGAIGQKVYNDAGVCTGIYIGTHEVSTKGGLKKVFDLYAAPEDLTDGNERKLVTTYKKAVKALKRKKNWHGYNGECFKNHQELEAALANEMYRGGWFIPTKEILHGKNAQENKVQNDNLFDHRSKMPRGSEFVTTDNGSGDAHWYWSCTEYRDDLSRVHCVDFTDGTSIWWGYKDIRERSTRPVRAELRGSDGHPVVENCEPARNLPFFSQ